METAVRDGSHDHPPAVELSGIWIGVAGIGLGGQSAATGVSSHLWSAIIANGGGSVPT
jgi:hypothetical protein